MSGPLRALVAVELRRDVAAYGKLVIGVGVALLVMASAGWLTGPRFGILVAVVGSAILMQVPGGVVREKLDGGIEFLVSLPVSRGLLAAARLVHVLLASVPCAIGFTALVALSVPGSTHRLPGGIWTLFAGIFVTTLVAGALMVGATLRFEVRHATNGLAGFLVLLIVVDELVPKVLPDPLGTTLRLMARPWAPYGATGVGALLVVVMLWLAFHLARTGLERYTPGRDRITW